MENAVCSGSRHLIHAMLALAPCHVILSDPSHCCYTQLRKAGGKQGAGTPDDEEVREAMLRVTKVSLGWVLKEWKAWWVWAFPCMMMGLIRRRSRRHITRVTKVGLRCRPRACAYWQPTP